ncbi:TBC1 domain family member 13 [Glycine max]|nr:TBC1 domain family member 13 [Glycine max]
MTVGNNSHLTSWFCKVEAKPKLLSNMLSQREINLEKLQRIASTGIPDGGGLREKAWKPSSSNEDIRFIRLSCYDLCYLSSSHDLWGKQLKVNRQKKYANLKEGSSPESEIVEQIDRDLQRTHPDLPFFPGESSISCKKREAMKNIILLFAKLNPEIRYVQGMNEVLAPIHEPALSKHDSASGNVEADRVSCFVRILGDSADHFCQQLDNSSSGILATLSRLSDLLKVNDEQLWRHFELRTKVKPQFYAFRWITLLLTQEFKFEYILRIWDTLLSNPFGDMLLRICCAMLLCVKSKLLSGDFVTNLKLLQHYPDDINIEYLLQVAKDIRPDTSYYCLSL